MPPVKEILKKDFSVFDISETVKQLKAGVSLTDEIFVQVMPFLQLYPV